MQRFEADYFDGRSSRLQTVTVEVEAGRAVIRGAALEIDLAIGELRVQPRLGSTPRRILLPDGALLITQDPVIEQALEVPRITGFAHRLESNLKVVIVSLIGLGIAAWFGYRDGIPWIAREAALRIPVEVESDLGVQGLRELDRAIFKPSALDGERQAQLRGIFDRLSAGGSVPAKLAIRDGGFIGANAFALPGGTVVMTDQLEEALDDDDQIAAVLAHEIGHLEHRHGMRHVLQGSISALVAAAVLGDLSSVATLAATVPAMVMHTSNSRVFEREADTFAYGLLKKSGRSPRLLGEALGALEKAHAGKARLELGYLSTHPATPERVRSAEEAAR